MRRFYSSALAGAILLFNGIPAFANNLVFTWDSSNGIVRYFKITSQNGKTNYESITQISGSNWDSSKIFFDSENQKVYQYETTANMWQVYDLATDSWSYESDQGNTGGHSPIAMPVGATSLISKDTSTGVTSIGENSFKFQETATEMKLWATNSSGEIAPINITNGTKLLINGRDVEQSINNVGALSAALTGLPTVPTDTTLACGFGTGTHGGDFAFSGGCASKVNEKLSINYAASMTMPGQEYAGDFEDKFSARAGFVWKLGKVTKPTLISMNDKKALKNEITGLKGKNTQLEKMVSDLQNKNMALASRLEKIELIALATQKDQKTAFSFFNGSNWFSSMKSFFISSK